ncbi:hypothetical protein GB937_001167 [Aspergillus fischeri]|nr:hypothetical protein GB937_001167 [Aspergillus fischeri]
MTVRNICFRLGPCMISKNATHIISILLVASLRTTPRSAVTEAEYVARRYGHLRPSRYGEDRRPVEKKKTGGGGAISARPRRVIRRPVAAGISNLSCQSLAEGLTMQSVTEGGRRRRRRSQLDLSAN